MFRLFYLCELIKFMQAFKYFTFAIICTIINLGTQFLILEGIIPLSSPRLFKSIVSYVLELENNTIRIIGGISFITGCVLLAFLMY